MPEYFDEMTRFNLPLSVRGWSAVNPPIERAAKGNPIGVQHVGKPLDDSPLQTLATERQVGLV